MSATRTQFRRVRRWLLTLVVVCPSLALALSADEALLLDRVRAIAAAPLDDFSLLGDLSAGGDAGYRYQLAFLSYGLCSVVQGEPALREEGRALFNRLLEKMEHPTTLAYWKAAGFEGDGLVRENAMYRGHLNLMYGLAHDRFGERRFDARFHNLSRALEDELNRERPICCEPDHLFIPCNSVCVLSLWLHDRAFGTSYAAAGKRLLAWARERMPLQGTTLVRDDYRPSTGRSEARRAGCANAWTIAFLAPVPGLETDVRAMYNDWRKAFAKPAPLRAGTGTAADWTLWLEETLCSGIQATTFGLLAGVKGAPAGETLSFDEVLSSGLLATTFGLLAARAAGDESLHQRLERTVACADDLVAAFEQMFPPERRVQVRAFRAVALFARTFRGWNALLGSAGPSL